MVLSLSFSLWPAYDSLIPAQVDSDSYNYIKVNSDKQVNRSSKYQVYDEAVCLKFTDKLTNKKRSDLIKNMYFWKIKDRYFSSEVSSNGLSFIKHYFFK